MTWRRTTRRGTPDGGAPPGPAAGGRDLILGLRDDGWILPRPLARDDVTPRWTRLGVVDGHRSATVDDRGLVTVGDRASLDWAIGAEDRWHLPARDANVSQARLDHAPVVETTLRVPGGTIVHRAYAARGPRYDGGDEWLVVEVENLSAVPVVLAWAVRPFSPVRVASTVRMDCVAPEEGTGPVAVVVDDAPFGLLPRPPSRWAVSQRGHDPLMAVVAGMASAGPIPAVGVEGGRPPSLALLHPLPHTATARVLLLPDGGAAVPPWPSTLPEAPAVAAGWTIHADRGPRAVVPDPVLGDAVDGARRSIALNHRVARTTVARPDRAAPTRHVLVTGVDPERVEGATTRAELLAAEAWWGPPGASLGPVAAWPEDQRSGGGFGSVEATAAAVRALALHTVAAAEPSVAEAWLPELGGAVEALAKAARRGEGDPAVVREALDAAGVVLERLGQARAAAEVRAAAPPASNEAPTVAETAGPPRRLAAAAVAAARSGRPPTALWELLRAASSTWTWPDPEAWTGEDGLVTARFLDAVARLLVRETEAGLDLVPWMPPDWWGQGWELHDAPTRWGRLSYAVRWHGERPAILWDLTGDDTGAPFRLGAPGLDPTWASTDRRGEALLAPVGLPSAADVADDDSTSDAPTVRGVAVAAPPRSVWRPQDPGPDAPVDPTSGRVGPPIPDRGGDAGPGSGSFS